VKRGVENGKEVRMVERRNQKKTRTARQSCSLVAGFAGAYIYVRNMLCQRLIRGIYF